MCRRSAGWIKIMLLVSVGLSGPAVTVYAATRTIDLDGVGWTFKATLDDRKHDVTVPHCWPVMTGYERYIGDAVYEHDFKADAIASGRTVRLHFDAVYYTAHVWLNGQDIGSHEGGYTPFEFDVTKVLKTGTNHLVVEVDNTPTQTTIPAIATARHSGQEDLPYGSMAGEGIFGWMPDLKRATAEITIRAFLHNAGDKEVTTNLSGSVAGLTVAIEHVRMPRDGDMEVSWHGTLERPHLWSTHDPYLYDATVGIGDEGLSAMVGVREISVRGTELFLNGRPVHLFGANRVSEDPVEGLRESDEIVNRDMTDMLTENIRMMRIAHYPQVPALLDFADSHGILLIAEAGNWNLSAWQMSDPELRATWQSQMREMMEQDWNHPSVIAWSVGNEYESATPQGIAWTRDMRGYTIGIDGTRLITFASRFTGYPEVRTGKDEASQYSDFVSVNIYGSYAMQLDRVHELWPDKPVFMTEFGHMGEPGLHDPDRIADITEAVAAMKARPWMIGGALWTWADYRSLHQGTPPDGIRRWGTVTFKREHRDSWKVVQHLFSMELP
jgi:beta-glucuronidase